MEYISPYRLVQIEKEFYNESKRYVQIGDKLPNTYTQHEILLRNLQRLIERILASHHIFGFVAVITLAVNNETNNLDIGINWSAK